MIRFLLQICHHYNSNIPRSSYTLSPLSNPQRIARSSAIMVATTPSIFSVDFSLSGFMLPAGSVLMKMLSIIHLSTGCLPCCMEVLSLTFLPAAVPPLRHLLRKSLIQSRMIHLQKAQIILSTRTRGNSTILLVAV